MHRLQGRETGEMKQKRCPYCGEYVQTNSLTCPKCFKEIPREPEDKAEYVILEDDNRRTNKVPSVSVLLAIIPPFFGLLGLGIIYLDHKNSKGYWMLVAGLILFMPSILLFFVLRDSGFFSAVLSFITLMILLLLYVSGAVAALIETVFGSVLKILRF
jgi:hypothetical protein